MQLKKIWKRLIFVILAMVALLALMEAAYFERGSVQFGSEILLWIVVVITVLMMGGQDDGENRKRDKG